MTPHDRKRHHALLQIFTNPVWQDGTAIIRRIADAAGAQERRFQRAMGAEWTEAYRADWDIADQVVVMLTGPDCTEVLTRFHMIENKPERLCPSERLAALWDHEHKLRVEA
jgi:hypothetical protein